MTHSFRALPAFLTLVTACALVVGCGAQDSAGGDQGAADPSTDAAADSPGRGTFGGGALGTIRATVDGESRSWYVVAGQAADGPYSSGTWFETGDGLYMAGVGGLDSENPPIETFSRTVEDPMGEYEGGALALNVAFDPAAVPVSLSLPGAPQETLAAMYMPVVNLTDMSDLYTMVSGTVEVEEAEISDGKMSIRGRFSGRFETQDGERALEMTEGTFEARGLPSAEAIQPVGDGGG